MSARFRPASSAARAAVRARGRAEPWRVTLPHAADLGSFLSRERYPLDRYALLKCLSTHQSRRRRRRFGRLAATTICLARQAEEWWW